MIDQLLTIDDPVWAAVLLIVAVLLVALAIAIYVEGANSRQPDINDLLSRACGAEADKRAAERQLRLHMRLHHDYPRRAPRASYPNGAVPLAPRRQRQHNLPPLPIADLNWQDPTTPMRRPQEVSHG